MATELLEAPALEHGNHEAVEEAVGGGVDFPAELEPEHTGPISKCDHGIYIPKGESHAIHCGLCNPDTYVDRFIRAAMQRRRMPSANLFGADAVEGVDEFMREPMGEKLAEYHRMAGYND